MKREVGAIIVEQRNQTAARVQQVLTGRGCRIQTRPKLPADGEAGA